MRALAAVLSLTLVAGAVWAADAPERRSGYLSMGPETRAMQDDDTSNPGMLWVLDGEALWRRAAGASGISCADCHGEARDSMKGVAAHYPRFDAASAKPIDLEGQINYCRVERQQAPALRRESRDLLALTAYVGHQSRGMPIEDAVAKDARLQPFLERGRAAFERRQGQLHLACAQCHNENPGKHLVGNTIPEAHPTGYPLYRLEWQGVGSLQRRLRNCLIGVRAEAYEYGAPEYVELQLYLTWRARGMTIETPAVRP
jgi:L-cysteine S-thiosulfotransferase